MNGNLRLERFDAARCAVTAVQWFEEQRRIYRMAVAMKSIQDFWAALDAETLETKETKR